MREYFLYNKDFFLLEFLKTYIKRALGWPRSGPDGVWHSVVAGLREIHVPVTVNSRMSHAVPAAVLSGVKTLQWAIRQKKEGNISRLVAGPNIAVIPLEYNSLILAPEIDVYMVPAQWSIDWWSSLVPEFRSKLVLWPAGVDDRGILRKPDGKVLVFQKNAPRELYRNVCAFFELQGLGLIRLEYGHFRHEEYLNALAESRYVVYLSQSESQGLALHEAWMADVPTLVWDRGYVSWKNLRWEGKGLSAPYMTPDCGAFFQGSEDFPEAHSRFVRQLEYVKPREYSLARFTNAISAQRLLEIMQTS